MRRLFKSPFLRSVGVIGGMIIGSGMFALPYAVWVSGFWGSLLGATLALFAVLTIHLAYGEIVANTAGAHRLPGYAKLYLGNFAGNFEKFAQILGFNLVLLVYGVLGGVFLSNVFGGSDFFWGLIFFVLAGVVLFWGSIGSIGWINFVLSVPLIAATLIISFYASANGSWGNITLSGADPFFAFGIFAFSLTGLSVIADARSLFQGKVSSTFRKSIITGTLMPLVLYVIFIVGVLMVSGSSVTDDALSGLSGFLGEGIIALGALVGVLAMFTSFLALGYDLKSIYEYDAGANPHAAWLLVFLTPLVIFILGATDFVKLISIIGGFFIAFDGIFVVLILRKLRQARQDIKFFLPFGIVTQIVLIFVFALSIVYELVYQVF